MIVLHDTALRSAGLIIWLLTAAAMAGGAVEVSVVDRDGQPVADVAVYAEHRGGDVRLPEPSKSAVMDQIDKQFVPHLLVVPTGTPVEFPNNDTIAHHVYSFSHPNKFKLPMYKGMAHPPVTFEHSGIVLLGCNIHDYMLGYILVVDSTIFAKTDASGKASLPLDEPGEYDIRIWSPRIRDGAELLSKSIVMPLDMSSAVRFQLAKRLALPHEEQVASWHEY